MNKLYSLILVLLLLSPLASGQEEGLEIYLTSIENPLDRDEAKLNGCICCMQPKEKDLISESFLSSTDIDYLDWERQIIYLTPSGQQKVKEFDFMQPGRLPGVPAALTLHGEIIYGLIIFPADSSHTCDRVYTYLKEKTLPLFFGSRNGQTGIDWRYGTDPRFDERLKHYATTMDRH